VILIERGRTIDRKLRRNRITLEELAAPARINAQIADLDEIEWAVLKTSRQISFIPKSAS